MNPPVLPRAYVASLRVSAVVLPAGARIGARHRRTPMAKSLTTVGCFESILSKRLASVPAVLCPN